MGTQRGQMKGVRSWLVRWTCHVGTIDFVLPWLLLSTQYFFLTIHYFHSFVGQAGQAAVLGRLSLSVCLGHTPQCTVKVSLNKPSIINP